MKKRLNTLQKACLLYTDGFRQMTWGRTLWFIILVKLFVIFAVLRVFFFRPALNGLNEAQKSEHVAKQLCPK